MESKKGGSSGDGDPVTVEIQFAEPDLVYTITYDGGGPAQAAFSESVEKGICKFLAATGISKEEFLSHPEANLDGKTVAEWAASTNSVPRVILTTKPKNGLLAKLQSKTKEAEVARMAMGARETVVKDKVMAMARALVTTPSQNNEEQLVREKKQLEKQLQAKEEQLLAIEQQLKEALAAEEAEARKNEEAAKKKVAEAKEEEQRARLVKQKQEQALNHNKRLQKQLSKMEEELETKENLFHKQREQLGRQTEIVEEEVSKQAEVFRGQLEETRAGYEAEKLCLEKKLEEKLAAYNAERSYRDKDNKAQKTLQKELKTKEAEKSSDERTITELIAVVERQGKKIVEIKEMILELQKSNSELQKSNCELQKSNSGLHKSNSGLHKSNFGLQKSNSELHKKNAKLERRVGILEQENAELTGKILELEEKKLAEFPKEQNPDFNSSELKELKQEYEKDKKLHREKLEHLWSAIMKLKASRLAYPE